MSEKLALTSLSFLPVLNFSYHMKAVANRITGAAGSKNKLLLIASHAS